MSTFLFWTGYGLVELLKIGQLVLGLEGCQLEGGASGRSGARWRLPKLSCSKLLILNPYYRVISKYMDFEQPSRTSCLLRQHFNKKRWQTLHVLLHLWLITLGGTELNGLFLHPNLINNIRTQRERDIYILYTCILMDKNRVKVHLPMAP